MRHVGQELALVLGGEGELLGLVFQLLLGQLDLAVLGLHVRLLQAELPRLGLELLVGLLERILLLLEQLLGFAQRGRLLLQAGVGLTQLDLLVLQLFRQRLRPLEQVFGAHVRRDRVEHDGDRLGKLIEQVQVDVGELIERGQLDDRFHLAFEQDRQDDDVQRRGLAQPGADLDVIAGHVGDQDAVFLVARTGRPALRPGGTRSAGRGARGRRSVLESLSTAGAESVCSVM